MAKKITRIAKLEFEAGKAKPGPELAGLGIIMPKFTKAFNDQTKDRLGEPVPVIITIYNDKSFTFVLKTSPASFMLKKAAGIKSGSANSKTNIVGKITNTQLSKIAKYKLQDLNTNNVELAQKIIAGTAKNMGIIAEGQVDEKITIQAAKDATKAVATANAKEAKLKAAVKAAIDTKDDEIEVTATSQSNKKEVDK